MSEQAMLPLRDNACSNSKQIHFIPLNNMARPRKNIDDLRIFNVMVALNKYEKNKLDKLILMREDNASVVIRELIINASLKVNRISKIDVSTHLLTRRISNNFNQYVRAVHETRLSKIELEIFQEIKDLLDRIHEKMLTQ
ncbi:hypothetical protein [Sphingobacterium sp. BN32]|uniref:hypothetical protein n=1 Tax=Sphingobacterium sp. BN32 TaxID=3058432 RepID=UPI00265D59A5|nr:hypothetical protein [Sphingobacterium sp. BN32]WKK60048.1 hypothetical protein QYC40_07325 [Sphingobacterium sp. BN32]